MNLVEYSDSEGSDAESEQKPSQQHSKVTEEPAQQPSFQKVVNRSDPRKIKVTLPSTASLEQGTKADTDGDGEPPAKRARVGAGGGLFSGLNSFLPAPKRTGQVLTTGDSGDGASTQRTAGQTSGNRVSLKTGAGPAFSRERPAEASSYQDGESNNTARFGPVPVAGLKDESEVKIVGKATMFRPLSVANKSNAKKKMKKPSVASQSQTSSTPTATADSSRQAEAQPPQKPKVSLFSMGAADATPITVPASSAEYKPILLEEPEEPGETDAGMQGDGSDAFSIPVANTQHRDHTQQPAPSGGRHSLQDLASDLNLSPAARRQLFGRAARNGTEVTGINVVNFNTDAEYAANEELRAKGEVVMHQPVRSIAPGKHSLRQLVNTAVTQKEALEESFAQGQKNRKEAGSRYGW